MIGDTKYSKEQSQKRKKRFAWNEKNRVYWNITCVYMCLYPCGVTLFKVTGTGG